MILYWGKLVTSDGCCVEAFESSSWFNTAGDVFILIILSRVIAVSMVFDKCLEKAKSTIKPAFCFFLSSHE